VGGRGTHAARTFRVYARARFRRETPARHAITIEQENSDRAVTLPTD
jgi:hypothetical protein